MKSRPTAPEDQFHPTLKSVLPLGAVPQGLRTKVASVLNAWGYRWEDVTFAGTAQLPPGQRWQTPGGESWVIAITAGPIGVGDEIEAAEGRAAGVQASGFVGGVIPATPYQAYVFEALGRRGGRDDTDLSVPPQDPGLGHPLNGSSNARSA